MAVARRLAVLVMMLLAAGCASGHGLSPYGRPATLHGVVQRTSGELLAASTDSIWLLRDSDIVGFSAASVSRVDVERYQFRGRVPLAVVGGVSVGVGAMIWGMCAV